MRIDRSAIKKLSVEEWNEKFEAGKMKTIN